MKLKRECGECGDALVSGETAYLLGGNYYCTSCVGGALVVYRRENELKTSVKHSTEYVVNEDHCGIPSRVVRL